MLRSCDIAVACDKIDDSFHEKSKRPTIFTVHVSAIDTSITFDTVDTVKPYFTKCREQSFGLYFLRFQFSFFQNCLQNLAPKLLRERNFEQNY